MRRTALALTTLAAGLAGTVVATAPAQAADTTQETFYSYTGLPSGWESFGINCNTASEFAVPHVNYQGRGGLRIGAASSVALAGSPDYATLLGADITLATPDGQGALILVAVSDADGDYAEGSAVVAPTAAGRWTDVDLSTVSFDVVIGNEDTEEETDFHGTLAQLREQTPALNDPGVAFAAVGEDCGFLADPDEVAATVYVDQFSVTRGTAEAATRTTWNFEAQKVPSVSIAAGRSVVAYGSSTSLSTVYKRGGVAVKDVKMQLLARPAGSTAYRAVATVPTDAYGRVRYSVRPTKNTAYVWKAPQSADTVWKAQPSSALTVKVRPKVSLALNDSSVRKGTKVYAYGTVSPAKGQVVSVYRKVGSRLVKLGSFTSNSQGKYRVYFTPKSTGTWTIVTRAAAKSGLATGQSTTKTLKVS